MPDILVRHIDTAMAERIMDLARERKWSINDVILHVLRHGLGLVPEDMTPREPRDIAHLRGTWNASEAAAFHEALSAFEEAPGSPLFSDPSPKNAD